MPTPTYQASGPGAGYLPYPALQFLLTTDPFLGTSTPGIPDGPFNRELHKLLQNDSALANLVVGYLQRTFGVSNDPAPVGVPSFLPGAGLTPADQAIHAVYFADYEIIYRYNATDGVWEEQARMPRVLSVFAKRFKKVVVDLEDGETDITIPLPTTDSNGLAFAFSLDDLKTYYVLNLDTEAPFIGVVPGIAESDSVLRVTVSSAPVEGSNYQLVLVFENIDQLS